MKRRASPIVTLTRFDPITIEQAVDLAVAVMDEAARLNPITAEQRAALACFRMALSLALDLMREKETAV